MRSSSSKRLLSLVVSVAFFIASLVVYVSLIKPAYNDIATLRGVLDAKRQQYNDHKNIIDRLRPVFESFRAATQLQQSFSSMLPTNPMIPQAVAQISGVAANNGITVNSINVTELATASQKALLLKGMGIGNLTVMVSANSYDSLKAFLEGIESNIRIFNIKRINIGNMQNAGGFTANLDIYSYYQIQ